MSAIVNKIEGILEHAYSTQNYIELMQEIFSSMKLAAPNNFHKEFTNFSSHIEGYIHIADYISPENKKIAIFAVQLKKGFYVENSRSTQRSYAKKLIESGNCDAAIVAFFTPDDGKWRLSFVRLDYEMKIEHGKLKIKENITPAKRYSFLVGEGEPCHTAKDRFRQFVLDNNSNPTLDELEEAFSVEKVTKEFFKLYCEKFYQLQEYLDANEDFVAESERCGFTSEQFAKKLMGQIVFLYFLQKKGWLGVNVWPSVLTEKEYKNVFYAVGGTEGRIIKETLPQIYVLQQDGNYRLNTKALDEISDSDEEVVANHMVRNKTWGDGSKSFLPTIFKFSKNHKGHFFENYLEPLFYETLNKNRGKFGYCPTLHCRIPFLSGGLFEPLDGYKWKISNFDIPDEIFSNKKDENDRNGTGILDIFDRYNFTMSEDEPMEREVAIDPEMLGKIFENLLEVKDRKSKGAFYTPREIVHYMCQESLINYLVRKTNISEDALRAFILYGDFMKDEDTVKSKREGNGGMYISDEIFKINEEGNIVVNRLKDIDDALASVRVADPAVGSGAFPLGMVNEIVRARENITEYLGINMNKRDKWFSYKNERSPYFLKKHAIKNSIFAVDIEPSAVDITQLRLWLSLVIDDEITPNAQNELEGHRDPIPLPNLESNIICGNSLIDEFEGIKLVDESDILHNTQKYSQAAFGQSEFETILNKLLQAQDELFSCEEPNKKIQLKENIRSYKDMIALNQFAFSGALEETKERYKVASRMASKPYVAWQLDFARVFRDNRGFDIVIGNPPYIGFHKVPNKEYNKKHFFTADGKYDFYVLFIEKALQLATPTGFVTYICPSYFYKRNYGKRTRELLKNKTSLKFIADFSDYQIFDTALTYTCIFGACKNFNPDNKIRILNKALNINDAHNIVQSTLGEPTWIFEKADTNAILEKVQMASNHLFGDITLSISQGIVTGNNDVYLISDDIIEERKFEPEYLHRAYKGKDVGDGKLHNGGYMVFYPYYVNEQGKTCCVSEEKLKQNCPHLYEYLLENKETLLSREYFVKSSKNWYELWNSRKMQHFYRRKFVFSEIGLINDFVLVDECFYTDSVCGSELKPEFIKYETFIHRYLNSRLATYVYKKVSVPKANGYSIYKNAFLKAMPIILPNDEQDFSEMSDEQFDTYIYNMVNLTADEIHMVETAQYSQV